MQPYIRRMGTQWLRLLFYAFILIFFVAPVARLLWMSLKAADGYGFQNFIVLLQEPRTIKAIENTLLVSIGSTVMATIAGTLMAFASAYLNLRHKHFFEMLILMPFIIPAYITTLSWASLIPKKGLINQALAVFGIAPVTLYSLGGILFVLGLCNIPIVYLSVFHMLRKIPRDHEWAARACGYSEVMTLFRINLPEALPAIVSGAILAFLASIDNFSVPAFLGIPAGIPVLSTYIYEKAIGFGPAAFPTAAALSVLLCIIAVGGTLLENMIRSGGTIESIREDPLPRIALKEMPRRLVEGSLLFVWILVDIIPLIVMISDAFLKSYGLSFTMENLSIRHFAFVLASSSVISAVRNSLILASVTSLLCILIGTAMAYLKVRRQNHAVMVGEKCASLTYAIPGIVLSLAMIFYWTEPFPSFRPGIYGTIYLLLIAYLTRYLILQVKGSTTALLSVSPDLEEASYASGRGTFATWRHILLPLLIKGILSSSFLIFVSSLTELTLSSMLASAGTKTIGMTIFNFQQGGEYSLSAAMSTVIVFMILGGYGVIHFRGSGKKENREREFISGAHQSAVRGNAGAR